jgi:hypothetical protein
LQDASSAAPGFSGPVGRRLIATILADAINPQYADRVEPMVAVLWELLQEPSTEQAMAFGPVGKAEPTMPGQRNPGMRDPPPKPKGPQDR